MCFPIKCVSAFLQFSAIIQIIISLAPIAGGIYVLVANEDKAEIWDSLEVTSNKNLAYILFGLGGFLFLSALCGWCGSRRRSSCLVTIYNFSVFVWFSLFFIVAIVALVYTTDLVDNIRDDDTCTSTKSELDWLRESNELSANAFSLMKSGKITLLVKDAEFSKELRAEYGSILVSNTDGEEAYSNFQDWAEKQDPQPDHIKNAGFMKFMEQTFHCSGLCQAPGFFMFSDVNEGTPKNGSCKDELEEFIHEYGRVIYIVAFSVAGYLALIVTLSCCMCCHPDRKYTEKKDFYRNLNDNYYGQNQYNNPNQTKGQNTY